MTLEELSKFDGKDGRKAYIGYNGKVYDITESDFWPSGTHMGMFTAGKDLSEFLCQSPHGEKNIMRYSVVADLDSSNATETTAKPINKKAKYQAMYVKYHPHPMVVHYPMALFPFALLLEIMNLIAGGELYLYIASVLTFTFATIMTLPVIATGTISLWINYNWTTNKYLKRKIILSIILFVLGVIGSAVGIMDLTHIDVGSRFAGMMIGFGVNPVYTVINFIMLLLVSGLGFYGGKLTWGNRG